MDGRAQHAYTVYAPDADAPYEQVIDVDLSAIRPTVAFPHLPENTKTIDEAAALNVKIDQVVIGSCTNGRLSDMAAAAAILKGRKVARRVRAIIIPATQHVYKECKTDFELCIIFNSFFYCSVNSFGINNTVWITPGFREPLI